MARTPFHAVLSAPGLGGATYTVPAGKIAIGNFFNADPAISVPYVTDQFQPVIVKLNGTDCMAVQVLSFSRYGPVVLTQGDIIGVSGKYNAGAVNTAIGRTCFLGFLYDTPTKKVPLRQIMVVGSSSYTVPAGKHIAVNFFGNWNAGQNAIKIDSDNVGMQITGISVFSSGEASPGPYTAAAGQVMSVVPAVSGGAIGGQVLMTGFLYDNA